jgi:hypothetical protein
MSVPARASCSGSNPTRKLRRDMKMKSCTFRCLGRSQSEGTEMTRPRARDPALRMLQLRNETSQTRAREE